jgi:hypothetical protein
MHNVANCLLAYGDGTKCLTKSQATHFELASNFYRSFTEKIEVLICNQCRQLVAVLTMMQPTDINEIVLASAAKS